METTTENTNSLNNPALIAAAQSPAGKGAITQILDTQKKVTEEGIKIAKVVGVVAVVGIACYVGYRAYQNRFISQGTNTNTTPANITNSQAQAKADAIYEAMYGWGVDFGTIKNNLAGLNQNAWSKVFNAFGKRKMWGGFSDMNLMEWLTDQLSDSEKAEIRFLIGNVI